MRYINKEFQIQEKIVREKQDNSWGYDLWAPENKRLRKETWEQLKVFKAVVHQKKSYPEIAEELGITTKQVGEWFRVAFTKSQGVPYDPSHYVSEKREYRHEAIWTDLPCNP